MDTHEWRRELDKLSEAKSALVNLNPKADEKLKRPMRHLYDVFAKLSQTEEEIEETSGINILKKRRLSDQIDKVSGELREDFMRVVRDLADEVRQEYHQTTEMAKRLQYISPAKAKSIKALEFPPVGAGDVKDFQRLYSFLKEYSDKYTSLHREVARQVGALLDENKRTLETYERHITIDRGEISATVSIDSVEGLHIADLVEAMEKLKAEKAYLDGRKDEVSRMLAASLVSEVESLQASVDTASRLGLELPIDYSKEIRSIARDATQTNNLTSLMSLESQLRSSKQKMANMLRDKIINIKHSVTSRVVEGGIPTSSDIIPETPTAVPEGDDVAALLSAYQKMIEWQGQVKIGLKDQIQEVLEEIEKATERPEDVGIEDILTVREFLANSKKKLEKAQINDMIKIYLKATNMQEKYRNTVTEEIREYLQRFNELATSADRVLDYAQLSKKAPKVDELQGGLVYLLKSLDNLRDAVESGVTTFRDAAKQELEAIINDLQTIKPEYAELFLPIIVDLEDGATTIEELDEFGAIRSEMRTIKDSILVKAKEALENLRYRLGVKIRLAAAKLMGAGVTIPGEVQDSISELNNVGVAADSVLKLPSRARKMIEIYENDISGEIVELLVNEVDELIGSFDQAAKVGVPMDKELSRLQNIKHNPPRELEAAAETYDELRTLTSSEPLQKKIRSRANQAYDQLKDAISIFEQEGMTDFVQRLNNLLDQVPEEIASDDTEITETLDVCLTMANIQEEMLDVIKNIASKNQETLHENLSEESKYYSTIRRVYERHPKEFSQKIFPLSRMESIQEELQNAEMLDTAIARFNEMNDLQTRWGQQAKKMDDWHKSLRMYMSGFTPGAPVDDRNKFIEDAKREIKDNYSKEDIVSYLSWAMDVIADTMVKKRE
ncbi:MAG: hypothetical protein ACOC38_04855 [Promethearchaeia archaeon]